MKSNRKKKCEGDVTMKFGTAYPGMRVRIIGNCNGHGLEIGSVVTLLEQTPYAYQEGKGYSFYVPSGIPHHKWRVREVDMQPVGAKVV